MASAPKKAKKEKGEAKSDTPKSGDEKDVKSLCERVNCPTETLACVVEVCNDCINRQKGDGASHPWTHLSLGEHVCNHCIDFYTKSQSIGYSEFHRWKKVWSTNGRSEAIIGTFICDQALPYWTQCMRCNKWREMGRYFDLSRDLAENFICTTGCEVPEDEKVHAAKQPQWINTLMYPPYLTQSPAAAFLKSYYPDSVGMSASENPPQESGGDNFSRPFHEANNSFYAMSVRPDVMDFDETLEFREFACAQQMYLCLRNLVIASWSRNPMEWLTLDKCRHSVICRGLVRVRCVQDLERIILFLTMKGVINCGILPQPPPSVFTCKNNPEVVIIGAGISGLAAAQHLYKHGIKATVLEAKDRLGGRIHTSRMSSGALLSLGPDIVKGSINNPVALMARQAKLTVQEFPLSTYLVLGKQNKAISADSMRKAENRYLEIIDLMYEWAQNPDNEEQDDVSVKDKVEEINKKLSSEEEEALSEEERQVVDMHLRSLAMNIGCDLSEVSARYWNAYEEYPQFGGPSFIIKQGLGALLMKMAGGLNIEYNKQVCRVVEKEVKVEVMLSDGSVILCDKVICTASLSVLKNNVIEFVPLLNEEKRDAINSLKCSQTEKVVMHFKKKFWAPKIHGIRQFTSLQVLLDPDSPIHMFHDMSSNAGQMLAMFVWGDKAKKYFTEECTREELESKLGAACLGSLKKIFPNAPEPINTSVSKWSSDKEIGLSRSYLPVGVDLECFAKIGEPIKNMIFFAGDSSIMSHPHSVCGAYISGVQQAIKVMEQSLEVASQ